jgi:hypothetical protein
VTKKRQFVTKKRQSVTKKRSEIGDISEVVNEANIVNWSHDLTENKRRESLRTQNSIQINYLNIA